LTQHDDHEPKLTGLWSNRGFGTGRLKSAFERITDSGQTSREVLPSMATPAFVSRPISRQSVGIIPRESLPAACFHTARVKSGSAGASGHVCFTPAKQTSRLAGLTPAKCQCATTEGRLLLSFAESSFRAALMLTLTNRFSYCGATVADDAEPTRLPISGAGASGM
jgi:hypothetical protein